MLVRSLCGFILMLIFLSSTLTKVGVIGWFNANKSYIQTNLCEQKNTKENTCQGKCYLKKRLKKTEQNKSSLEIELLKIDFIASLEKTKEPIKVLKKEKKHSRYLNLYRFAFSKLVTDPPQHT